MSQARSLGSTAGLTEDASGVWPQDQPRSARGCATESPAALIRSSYNARPVPRRFHVQLPTAVASAQRRFDTARGVQGRPRAGETPSSLPRTMPRFDRNHKRARHYIRSRALTTRDGLANVATSPRLSRVEADADADTDTEGSGAKRALCPLRPAGKRPSTHNTESNAVPRVNKRA